MYYLNVDLYRYFIGRGDQSVNETIMISRIDQQIRVNKAMMDCDIMSIKSRKLRNYMIKFLAMVTAVTTVLCIKGNTDELTAKKNEVWQYMKEKDEKLYKAVLKTPVGLSMQLEGNIGRKILMEGYNISQKLFGFN